MISDYLLEPSTRFNQPSCPKYFSCRISDPISQQVLEYGFGRDKHGVQPRNQTQIEKLIFLVKRQQTVCTTS